MFKLGIPVRSENIGMHIGMLAIILVIVIGAMIGLLWVGGTHQGRTPRFLPSGADVAHNHHIIRTSPQTPIGGTDVYDESGIDLSGLFHPESPPPQPSAPPSATPSTTSDRDGLPDATPSAPEQGAMFRAFSERAAREGKDISPAQAAQVRELDRLTHAPLFPLSVTIDNDTMGDINLKREHFHGLRVPIKGTDPAQQIWYEPIQQETPWLAFRELAAQVAAATPEALAAASNGGPTPQSPSEPFAAINLSDPEVIPHLRGRVFDVRGVLWSLKEQPLAQPIIRGERQIETAWIGVVSYLRPGLAPFEPGWVNDSVMFTTLSLPDALKPFALKPGQHPDNDDALARGNVEVSLRGVFLRRIMYWDTVAKMDVTDGIGKEATRSYTTEVYLPWLVCPAIERTELVWPDLAAVREMVTLFSEGTRPFESKLKDKFDEAGYYLLLRSIVNPSSRLHDLPQTELTFRMLTEQSQRDLYRGARITAKGLLHDIYFPLILPPNISGRRNLYRSFVLDTLDWNKRDDKLMWYVDLLDPPHQFQGRAAVQVDGFYYRSQLFNIAEKDQVRGVVFPLLLAPRLTPLTTVAQTTESSSPLTVIGVTGAVVGVVLIALVMLGLKERQNRTRFERESVAAVRQKLASTRKRLAQTRPGQHSPGPSPDATPQPPSEPDTPS